MLYYERILSLIMATLFLTSCSNMYAKSTSTTESPVIKQPSETPITKPITTSSRIQTIITITAEPSLITKTLPFSTTQTATPTRIPTLLTILNTSTPTPTITPTVLVGGKKPPLSEVVLSIDDFISANEQGEIGTFINAYKGGFFSVLDMTSELDKQCIFDCVKIVWYAPFPERSSDSASYLTFILFLTSSPEKAHDAVDSLYQETNNTSNPEHYDYTSYLHYYDLPEDSKAVWNNNFVLITDRGNVVVVLMSDLKNVRDIDNPGEIGILAKIAVLQLEKLRNVGFPP